MIRLKDRVKIRVYGSQTYTINFLNKKNIAVYRAVAEQNAAVFEIDGKRLAEVRDALLKDGRRFEILVRKGVLFTLKKGLKKFGLAVGLIAVVCAMFAYSEVVYGVEFSGDPVDEAAAMAILEQEGVSFPAFRPAFDRRKLEIALLKLRRVSSATVQKVGNRLKITFLNELTPPPVIDMTDPVPVLSRTDAVVTRLVVMSGTALVKAGDAVKKGATLIAPYLLVNEEEVPVRGVGEIYGKVYHGKTLYYPDTVMTASRTGRYETRVEIRIGGIATEVRSPFISFEEEIRVVKGSPVLPIEYVYHTFYETEFVGVPFDFEREKELLIKEGFDDLERSLPQGATVLDRFYNVKRVDNSTVLELYYETEELLNEG